MLKGLSPVISSFQSVGAMNNMKLAVSPSDGARLSALSPASCKVLGLLHKGCAYRVRGAWRFRGLRGPVKEQAFLSLFAMGLAERVETDRCAQVRITRAGRWVSADAGSAHPPHKP